MKNDLHLLGRSRHQSSIQLPNLCKAAAWWRATGVRETLQTAPGWQHDHWICGKDCTLGSAWPRKSCLGVSLLIHKCFSDFSISPLWTHQQGQYTQLHFGRQDLSANHTIDATSRCCTFCLELRTCAAKKLCSQQDFGHSAPMCLIIRWYLKPWPAHCMEIKRIQRECKVPVLWGVWEVLDFSQLYCWWPSMRYQEASGAAFADW